MVVVSSVQISVQICEVVGGVVVVVVGVVDSHGVVEWVVVCTVVGGVVVGHASTHSPPS